MNILNTNWREVIVAVLSAIIIALGKELGLEETSKEVVGLLAGTYIGSSAVASISIKKRMETFTRKLASRKFQLTLLSIALTVLGSKLNIDLGWAIGILGGLGNVGIAIADAKGATDHEDTTVASFTGPIAPQFSPDEDYGD